jgi:dihydroorotate dehydrogenase (NAD+) catalytic subunit
VRPVKTDDPILAVDLAGLKLRNPVMLAAGTAGTLDEMADVMDLSRVGAVVTKSITLLPREGNQTWRIVPSKAGMLNAIGLANIGLDEFLSSVAPRITSVPTAVIGSIAGFSVDDYVRVAAAMDDLETLRAVELNVSCPNVHGGTEFGADAGLLRGLIGAVRPVLKNTRLLVKLSPVAVSAPGNTMVDLARAAIEGAGRPDGPNQRPGADALCISNTMPAMAIDVRTRRPVLANVTGGLSGPAIHPIVVRLIHLVYQQVAKPAGVPIVGIGGVLSWDDAAEFVLAGASAVQMGTALFADPRAPARVARGLASWAKEQKSTLAGLVGGVRLGDPR